MAQQKLVPVWDPNSRSTSSKPSGGGSQYWSMQPVARPAAPRGTWSAPAAPAPAPEPPAPPPAAAPPAPAAPATPKPSASDAFQRAGTAIPDSAAGPDDTRTSWSFTQFRPDTRAALYDSYRNSQGADTSSSSSDSSQRPHYGSGWRSNLASERKAGGDDFLRHAAGLENTLRLRGLG